VEEEKKPTIIIIKIKNKKEDWAGTLQNKCKMGEL